jgi:acyl-CoA thioesterase
MIDTAEAAAADGGLDAALRLRGPAADGRLAAELPPSFSLAPSAYEPDSGAAHGGLIAALALQAARQGLGLEAPLRTLTVQFLAGARFGPMTLEAELTRAGRSAQFAGVRGRQSGPVFEARLTFGGDGDSHVHRPPSAPQASPPETAAPLPQHPKFTPRFTHNAQYGLVAVQPFSSGEPRLLLWMREASGAPLDELRLAFLLDAVFPAFYAALDRPVRAASVDLRYDFTGPIGAADAPDGWVLFEFLTRDFGEGWAIEDGAAWSRSGRLLAVARQLRKTLAKPGRAAE